MSTSLRFGLAWILGVTLVYESRAAEFHVAPDGSQQGNGSPEKSWDLATALVATDVIQPGDTVWLRAGTYRGGFVSRLAGKPGQPITVRGERTGRVTIDTHPRDVRDNGLFLLFGADVVYRDFEVTCSHPNRETKTVGSWPEDIRRGSVDVRGDRLALVNLVVHDCAGGFGFWSEGEGGEITGCLIYNNGWRGPDRGHGHGIYVQNALGTKRMADNIVFHQFAYGLHAYGSEKASLKGLEFEGNIIFENGCLASEGNRSSGLLVGGGSPAERITVRNNVVIGGNVRLGYPWGTTSEDVEFTGNYCDGGLIVRDFRKATVTNNVIASHSNVVTMEAAEKLLLSGKRWNENQYYLTDGRWGECSVVEENKSRGMKFEDWKTLTGFDDKSTFTKSAPTEMRVIVRPNPYESGRAHVAVLNPGGLAEVDVDLSKVLKQGQEFRIVSAKDIYGPPLVTGTYDGKPVRLAMKPISPPSPVGMPDVNLPVTEPHFGAFVVLPE
jgi:hypothetical protein